MDRGPLLYKNSVRLFLSNPTKVGSRSYLPLSRNLWTVQMTNSEKLDWVTGNPRLIDALPDHMVAHGHLLTAQGQEPVEWSSLTIGAHQPRTEKIELLILV
jgi:hypothetical protein